MKKNILLIGGSHGIGRAIVESLNEDHNLFVASRTNDDLQDLEVTHIEYDVNSGSLDTADLPDTLDGFVYCPGTINLKPFNMLSEETFEEDMQLNFFGLIKSLKTVTDRLKKSEQASLVFFSTVAVKIGMPFHTSVAASKGAIEGFAKALAAEYAPNFRVNVIAPSLTDTPLAEKLLGNDKKREKMDERHPLKRVGTPQDIAKIASFLLSDDSSWVTGQILGVDGGMSTLNVN
ncbi:MULTISPECIES: SDR family NAD(P)-dependent oxidoreductase [unclassified Leeuwenhoekiella]|uniref:SDR family NAD(P)-dependent oxidoreductase n=1 Tax=unclassified Leeuwenhoekiella TaxID=2615029 RepID=UPI000C69042B|nr:MULTISPECIES: SDR family oxidoreductase [unclassified Leeuwenhoekiella]MAW93693.1 oxidoreductase [Leeuwenhoekiella sp.]MBA83083.1 oxidoreductase [Leeuwenhoekiella sp.]|tara:strand:- start:53777 stop:54475 length:699 start_codon:yes stop_codon:yes gene_type:complete